MSSYLDWMDKDNDGSMLDDGAKLAAQGTGALMGLGGAGLAGAGTMVAGLGALGGGALVGLGTGLAGAGLAAEFMPVPGARVAGTTAIAAGLAIGGAGLGLGGAAIVGGGLLGGAGALIGAGGAALGTFGADVAEEVGDFSADALGTRGAAPYAPQDTDDRHYASGRTDGLGQQLNAWWNS